MKISSLNAKQRLLALAVFSFLVTASGQAQTGISITYYDGNQQAYSITTSGKLYFENGNLQIVQTDASAPVSIPVSIIRKINLSTAATSPLPLRMVTFTIVSEINQVTLAWKTENEINTSHFLIERSVDGTNYESIAKVTSLNKSSGGAYNFADLSPKPGVSYYRLKLVDADGKYEYSKVLTVKRSTSGIITLLPNPAANYIKINSTAAIPLNVKIYSSDGRLVISGVYTSGEQISISKLTSGTYTTVVNDKSYKFIKQ